MKYMCNYKQQRGLGVEREGRERGEREGGERGERESGEKEGEESKN